MKTSTLSAIVLSSAVVGFAGAAQAQSAKLFFEGDLERGAQAGQPNPGCVLNSQFKHKEKVVFRVRVTDQTGKQLDDKGLKSLDVMLPDGQKLSARFSAHPPKDSTDHFWTAAWIIPSGYPTGGLSYKVVATGLDGQTTTWEPFKVGASQLTVLAGDIELKP